MPSDYCQKRQSRTSLAEDIVRPRVKSRLILLDYTPGTHVPNIDKRIHYVIAVVIFVSLLPAIISAWKARTRKIAPL